MGHFGWTQVLLLKGMGRQKCVIFLLMKYCVFTFMKIFGVFFFSFHFVVNIKNDRIISNISHSQPLEGAHPRKSSNEATLQHGCCKGGRSLCW